MKLRSLISIGVFAVLGAPTAFAQPLRKGNIVNKKLFSTAAIVLSLAAASAFAAADGPDYDFAAAQGSVARAEVNAQAVQAQRESRSLVAAPDGDVATAAATPAAARSRSGVVDTTAAAQSAARSRADVKAETVDALRVSGLGLVSTPY